MSQQDVTEPKLVEHFISKLLKTKNPDDMIADTKETGSSMSPNPISTSFTIPPSGDSIPIRIPPNTTQEMKYGK